MNSLKEVINKYITAVSWCLLHEGDKRYLLVLERIERAENELIRLGVSDSAIVRLFRLCEEKIKEGYKI